MATPARFRASSHLERRVLSALLSAEFRGNAALREQAKTAQVRVIDADGSLEISAGEGPRADVDQRVPIEGEIPDRDGIIIHILLHVVDGNLNELEIYREDSGPIGREIDPDELQVIVVKI